MPVRSVLAILFAVAVLVARISAGQAASGANGILQQWSGRVSRGLSELAPARGFITTQKELEALWEAWSIKDALPTVDFTQHLVIVSTGRSSVVQVRAIQVDEKGNLIAVRVATPDMTRDVAFVLTLTDRKGVKTIHGFPVP